MNEMKRRLISTDEVADILGVHPATVENLVARRQIIQPVKFGRNVRFDAALLDRWIEGGCLPIDKWEGASKKEKMATA